MNTSVYRLESIWKSSERSFKCKYRRGHHHGSEAGEKKDVPWDDAKARVLEQNRLQGIDCISLGIYLCEGLQPTRKARDRIHSAAGEEKYDVQKAAQDADYPGMSYPSEDDKHEAEQTEGSEEDDN